MLALHIPRTKLPMLSMVMPHDVASFQERPTKWNRFKACWILALRGVLRSLDGAVTGDQIRPGILPLPVLHQTLHHAPPPPPPSLPPSHLFFTRHLITHRASWMDLSASSSTSLLEPLTMTDTVLAVEEAPVT